MLYTLILLALLVGVLWWVGPVKLAKLLKLGVDELEDIVGDFTSLDDRLGAFVSRKEQEARDKRAEAEAASLAASDAEKAATRATRVQARVQEIVR